MSFLSVSFHTLGCKLNQLETESIAESFSLNGFKVIPWGSPADIFIVNTCTVTSKAEQKARRVIRKALKDNPHASVIATGCYAQLDPESLVELGLDAGAHRLVVLSANAKAALLDLPAFLAASTCSSADIVPVLFAWARGENSAKADGSDRFRFDANDFSFHSRASLKIQDGCDNSCAYCRVRLARGRSICLAASEILLRLRELEARGYAEAVLTGINLSRYRDEVAGAHFGFAELITYLLAGTERISLRLSSIEPDGVDEAFVQAVSNPRVRPHFHLSVQSGSNAVLAQMKRRYTREQVLKGAALLRASRGDAFFACDIITGFPGETDSDFQDTFRLCEEIGFAWIHAFPFSPRPGTEAIHLPNPVPERVSVERVERLIQLAKQGRAAYIQRSLGREYEAVVEGHAASLYAVTENYLKVKLLPATSDALRGKVLRAGSAIRCRIQCTSADDEIGDAVAEVFEVVS